MSALDGILSGANDPACVLYGTDDPYFDLHDRQEATAELSALRAENARMREALEFYAERTGTHVNGPVPKGAVDRWAISEGFPYYNCGARDGGKIARAALGGRDA